MGAPVLNAAVNVVSDSGGLEIGRKLCADGLAWCTYTGVRCTYTAREAAQTGDDMNAKATSALAIDCRDHVEWVLVCNRHHETSEAMSFDEMRLLRHLSPIEFCNHCGNQTNDK